MKWNVMAILEKFSGSDALARSWGYILAILGAACFSMKAVFVKMAYGPTGTPDVDVITLLALRTLFALPFFLVIGFAAWKRRSKEGRELPDAYQIILIASLGLLGYYGCSFLDFQGLTMITTQLERLLLYTYPFFVVIFSTLLFGSRLTPWNIGPLLFSYCGIVVIFFRGQIATGDYVMLGSILVLLTAMLFGLYQVLANLFISRFGSRIFTCLAMSAACLGVITHFMIENSASILFELPAHIIWIGFLMAIVSTVMASFMINAALEHIGPQAVAIIGTLSPMATVVMAILILNEPFGITDAIGTSMVIAGIAIYTWFDAKYSPKC